MKSTWWNSLQPICALLLLAPAAAMGADDEETKALVWALFLRPQCEVVQPGFAERTAAAYATVLKQHPKMVPAAEEAKRNYEKSSNGTSQPPTEQELRNCARLEEFIVGRNAAPDSRLASPESTWKFLLASLRKGDKDGVFLCLTVDTREMFESMFQNMSAEQLREVADSFTGFQPLEKWSETFQEVAIVRGDHATIAHFQLIHGNWKLNQL